MANGIGCEKWRKSYVVESGIYKGLKVSQKQKTMLQGGLIDGKKSISGTTAKIKQ